MSGLIWGALGQSVANAGSTIGGMMMRDIEDQRRREEEERREERAMRRMEEADRIKSEREAKRVEDLEQRVAREATDVRTRAEKRGAERATKQAEESTREAGTRATNAALIESNRGTPGYGQSSAAPGLVGEKLTPAQRRLQRAGDEAEAALEMGAHSSVVKFFEKKREDTLNQIREENRTTESQRRDARLEAAEERRSREFQALLPLRQQAADAATTRAERPPAGAASGEKPITGVDLERTAKAAEKELALVLGVPVQQVPETVASRLRKAQGRPLDKEVQSALDNYNASLQRWREFRQKPPGEAATPAPAAAPAAGAQVTKNYSNLWK